MKESNFILYYKVIKISLERFIIFIVLFLSLCFNAISQHINEIKVPSTDCPTLQQSLSEFYVYATSYNYLTLDTNAIKSKFGYSQINWNEQMLMWSPDASGSRPYWTAFVVISYAQVYRIETDSQKKALYAQRAKAGAEYLLWLQANSCVKGGLPSYTDGKLPTSDADPFNSAISGIAFIECWKSFGSTKYFEAALDIGDYLLDNPIYPYLYPPENYRYYSNVNQLSRTLWFFSEIYKITDDQKYLDRSLQVAEEIMAWQDYKDDRDPWGEVLNADSTWDGSWYYYDYSPQPIPKTCQPNLGARNGFGQDRRMSYHSATLYSLIKLLEATQQQILHGTISIRNNQPFNIVRNKLINSIKRGLNFMIDNQEEVNSANAFRGLFKEYKNYRNYYIDNNPTFRISMTSAPHGLTTIADGFLTLLKANALTLQDQTRLLSLINGVSTNMLNKHSGNWWYNEWLTEGMMFNWARYIEFQNSIPSSILTLKNNSFEDKEIIWEFWSEGSSSVSVNSSEARTGTNSIHIIDTDKNASPGAALLITAIPYTDYQVQGYHKLLDGSAQSIGIEYYDANLNLISSGYQQAFSQPHYQLVKYKSLSPSNAAFLRIILFSSRENTSEGYWDDISANSELSIDDEGSNNEISLNNYPNPFNQMTKIKFIIPKSCYVSLKIYDVLGSEVADLLNGILSEGIYYIDFDSGSLQSGYYFNRLIANNEVIIKEMLLVK